MNSYYVNDILGKRSVTDAVLHERVVTLRLTFADLLSRVMPVELIDTAREREADEQRESHEAQYIVHHSAERQL